MSDHLRIECGFFHIELLLSSILNSTRINLYLTEIHPTGPVKAYFEARENYEFALFR